MCVYEWCIWYKEWFSEKLLTAIHFSIKYLKYKSYAFILYMQLDIIETKLLFKMIITK